MRVRDPSLRHGSGDTVRAAGGDKMSVNLVSDVTAGPGPFKPRGTAVHHRERLRDTLAPPAADVWPLSAN